MAMFLLPGSKFRQEFPYILFISDEIVIDNENGAAPAKSQQRVKLAQNLLIALGAGYAAVDFNDVANLAVERAAARILNRHCTVAFHFREVEVSYLRRRQWRS